MARPVPERTDEARDDLWRDDELSDEALDRAAGQGAKLSGSICICPCATGCRGGRS